MQIIHGNSLFELKKLEENSVDSIVTDPPYGLSFMGKKWDYDVPSVDLWKEAIRVLKPGGHLLSFAGSRTYHRMAVNIEDAGFEIRDQIMWVYGSGFPKSHNIGKAVDKLQGNEREVVDNPYKSRRPNGNAWVEQLGDRPDELTKGTSPYEGWGTALKPAHEPIVVARKPLSEKTIANNVLKWGTGGINIDECRVGTEVLENAYCAKKEGYMSDENGASGGAFSKDGSNTVTGRFPANFIHSGLEEEWARYFYCAKASKKDRNEGLEDFEEKSSKFGNQKNGKDIGNGSVNDKFTNQPRANFHPTVKPTKLMQYLVRLVTPKGGTVLDPFMGSGSTGKACKKEGFDFIGIELDKDYVDIATSRIAL
jgi:DNA modification methylase